MIYPNYHLERELIKQGYKNIIGIDEAGRGAWAGPLVAAAIRLLNVEYRMLKCKIRDSKLLSENQREKIFEVLSKKVVWSIGIVSHKEIDERGLTWANTVVVERALMSLKIQPDFLLIDQINGFKHQLPHQLIIDGDYKVLSIAAASILAKVWRDRLMRKYHEQYPNYHFDKHKGYGTALHQQCLNEYGACAIHRRSFKPIKNLTNGKEYENY